MGENQIDAVFEHQIRVAKAFDEGYRQGKKYAEKLYQERGELVNI